MSPSLIQKLSQSILSRPQAVLTIITLFAIFGTVVVILGGIWDAMSHIAEEPEFFWTIQHVSIYSGVAMSTTAGMLGLLYVIKKSPNKNLKKGIKIVMIGSAIQIVAGFADSISHEIFGIDGLVSWSHQPLEFGLVLSALGGFLIIKSIDNSKLRKVLPLSISTLILSIVWLGFNLSLLLGGTFLCMLVYEMFSSGCAIL